MSSRPRPTCSGASSRAGFSLLELSISSAILLMLLGAVTLVMRTVVDYHRRTDDQIALERSTLLTLKTISRECSESAWTSIALGTDGFVFATPRDPDGNFLVGSTDQPAWSGFVCYSRETDRLLKRVDRFATPNSTVPDPMTSTPARDLAWFVASGLPARPVQTGVEQFAVTRQTVGDEDGQDVLKIEMTAGVGEPGPRHYTLKLSTSVRPRN